MSLQRTQAVACDVKAKGCQKLIAECSTSAREARSVAASLGWYRQGERDICPSCVAVKESEPEVAAG